MIIQGSNNPLVIFFDASVENIAQLTITIWSATGSTVRPVMMWTKDEMLIDGEKVVCMLKESATRNLVTSKLVLEAKGLDSDGETVFWEEYPIDLHRRRDRIIHLTQGG